MGIQALFTDPIQYLRDLLITLPAILPALILHECAHGWVAYKLGDPTAKMMGRLSLDPRKHLDPIGTVSMVLIGLGWARPVPVNPRYFKHPRRDDFLVSIAGITANLIMFLLGILAYMLLQVAAYHGMDQSAGLWDTLYEIIIRFFYINLGLAVFNLIPIPPLDGYHVLNDLILGRRLFASAQAAQIGRLAMFALLLSGVLGEALSKVETWIVDGVLNGVIALFRLIGLI